MLVSWFHFVFADKRGGDTDTQHEPTDTGVDLRGSRGYRWQELGEGMFVSVTFLVSKTSENISFLLVRFLLFVNTNSLTIEKNRSHLVRSAQITSQYQYPCSVKNILATTHLARCACGDIEIRRVVSGSTMRIRTHISLHKCENGHVPVDSVSTACMYVRGGMGLLRLDQTGRPLSRVTCHTHISGELSVSNPNAISMQR